MNTTNLSNEIEKQLPAGMVAFLKKAGQAAAGQGKKLYLVGGVVRDLLLKLPNLDLDLVVEGDAIDLAQSFADSLQGKLTIHPSFGTAKIRLNEWNVDFATARSETYSRPGALPTVKPGDIETDLFRRDFTVNAMAVELTASRYGRIIDTFDGRKDLSQKLIRVLHDKSFIDDATRIWRAIRYEQRLDFEIEPVTLGLLKRDIDYLDTITGDRLRHELELVLKEAFPEKALLRASELEVLQKLYSALIFDDWLEQKFKQARDSGPAAQPVLMALLAYRFTEKQTSEFISKLRLQKTVAEALRDSQSIKKNLESLSRTGIKPSQVYSVLNGRSQAAITVNYLAADSAVVKKQIELFQNKLRYVQPTLTGTDLLKLGISPGPRMKQVLQKLLEAKLDGKVKSKEDEKGLVKVWTNEVEK